MIPPVETLSALVEAFGDELPLDRAMLAVARVEYPALDEPSYLRQLDLLAAQARAHLDEEAALLPALRRALFAEARFRGAAEDYYDPRNSLLCDVLDRRTGIPITLAVVYIEVARRAGGQARGIGFPGHFLVRDESGDAPVLLDPFAAGARLLPADCERFLKKLGGGAQRVEPWMLAPATGRATVARVLTNLKHAYLRKKDTAGAITAIERLMVVEPGRRSELRDRGLLYAELGLVSAAERDLEVYLASSPAPDEAEWVGQLLPRLRARRSELH